MSVAATATLAGGAIASAAQDFYTGTSSTTFADPANWSLGVAPTAGNDAVFNGPSYVNQPTLTAPASVLGLVFGNASGTAAGAVTIGGSATAGLTLGTDGIVAYNGSAAVLVSAPLTLSANGSFITNNSATSLTIANISSGANPITFAGSGTTYISATAGGTSGTGYLNTSGGLIINSTGTVHLAVTAVPVTGGVTVNSGTLSMDTSNFNSGPFAAAQTFTVNAGGTLIVNATHALANYYGAVLVVNGGTVVSRDEQYLFSLTLTGGTVQAGTGGDGSYELRASYFGTGAITSMASSTTSTISDNLNLANTSTSNAFVFNVNPGTTASGIDLSVTGNVIGTGLGVGSGGAAVVKGGLGTLALTGSNTYLGNTSIGAGTLSLGTTGNLNASSGLIFGAGQLVVAGAQTVGFSATNLSSGGVTFNTASGSTVNLGAITRSLGASVGFGLGTTTTTTANTGSTGILGGWAVVGNGASFAVSGGNGTTAGTITQLGGYTEASAAGTASANYAGVNLDVDASTGATDGPIAPNAIRFSAAGSNTLTLVNGSTVATGGILLSPAVGTNTATIAGGTLAGGGGELDLDQYDTAGTLAIASTITDFTSPTTLVKAGPGAVTLSGANSYSGGTFVGNGVLSVGADANLGTAPATATANSIVIDGGTLSGNATFNVSSNRGIAVGGGVGATYGTIDAASGVTLGYGGIVANATGATGGLVKTGLGTVILAGTNTYTGNTVVNAGTLMLMGSGGPNGALASPQVIVNAGGTLALNGSSSDIIGYSGNREALVINSGGTVTNNGQRTTIDNTITMTGGTLAPSASGGQFELNTTVGFKATSDASGLPALVSVPLSETGATTYNVTRGTAAPASDMNVSSVISTYSGTTPVIKTGNGTLTLTANNTFNGGLNVSGGTVVLTATNSYTGGTVVNGGTLILSGGTGGSNGVLYNNPQIVVNYGGTLQLNSPSSDVLGYSSGREALVINSGGTVTNTGQRQTIENPITMTGGTLAGTAVYEIDSGSFVATSDAAGNPAVVTASIPLNTASTTFNVSRGSAAPSSDMNVSSSITNYGGTGGILKIGNGVLTLTANEAYAGTTNVSAGTLVLTGGNTAGGALTSPSVIVGTGATLQLTNNDTLGYTAGRGALTINGGTVVNTAATGSTHDTLASTVTMVGGTLAATSTTGAGYAFSFFNANGLNATSDGAGNPALISARSGLQSSTTINFNVSQGALAPAVDLSVTGAIIPQNGSLTPSGLTKIGSGVMAVSGANTYTGGTNISGGTFLANAAGAGNSSTGTGAVTVNVGSILAGTGNVAGPVAVFGTISAGSGSTANRSIGTLTTGAQTWNASGGYAAKVFTNGTTASSDLLQISGLTIAAPFTVTVLPTNLSSGTVPATTSLVLALDTNTAQGGVFSTAITANALLLSNGGVSFSDGSTGTLAELDSAGGEQLLLESATTAAAPEPTSLLLAAAALAPFSLARRRRRA